MVRGEDEFWIYDEEGVPIYSRVIGRAKELREIGETTRESRTCATADELAARLLMAHTFVKEAGFLWWSTPPIAALLRVSWLIPVFAGFGNLNYENRLD